MSSRDSRSRRDKDSRDQPSDPAQKGGSGATSMSVQATNEMRAKLGLKPLAVMSDSDKLQALEQAQKAQDAAQKEAETEQLRDELAKRRNQRLLKAELQGESLGESLKKELPTDAASWVARSRAVTAEVAAKLKAEQKARELAEQEAMQQYSAEDLKGLRVAHEADQFGEGESSILTLKDSYVLKGGLGKEDNDEEDVLENAALVSKEKQKEKEENKKKKPRYDATDENAQLLPQYDEKEKPQGIRLDPNSAQGIDAAIEKEKAAAALKDKLGEVLDDLRAGKKKQFNLTTEIKPVSDFKEVKFKKKKKDGKSKSRKAATAALDLDDFLPEPSAEERAADHASRSAQRGEVTQIEEEKRKQALRDASYLRAIQKAEVATSKLMEVATTAFEDEEDVELQNALERSRRLKAEGAERKKHESIEEVARAARAKAEAERAAAAAAESNGSANGDAMAIDEVGGEAVKKEDEGIVFTATHQFSIGLDQQTREQARERAELAAKREAASVKVKKEKTDDGSEVKEPRVKKEKLSHPSSSSSSHDGQADMDIDEDNERDSEEEDEAEPEDKTKNQNPLEDEPTAGGGVAAALKLAKLRGFTQQKKQLWGRANDKPLKDEDGPGVKLEYTDEAGNPITPKEVRRLKYEAFRRLCHAFHGRGPGAMKKEKELKRKMEAMKNKKAQQKGASKTLNKLKKQQKTTGVAYVVLDKKPGIDRDLPLGVQLPGAAAALSKTGVRGASSSKKKKTAGTASKVRTEGGMLVLPGGDDAPTGKGVKRKREE